MTLTKAELAAWLTENGLVVEGDELKPELVEARRYMMEYLNSRTETEAILSDPKTVEAITEGQES